MRGVVNEKDETNLLKLSLELMAVLKRSSPSPPFPAPPPLAPVPPPPPPPPITSINRPA